MRMGPLAILFIGVCAVASGGLFGRVGLDAGTNGFTMSLWRLTVSGLVLTATGLLKGDRHLFERKDQIRMAVAGLFLALHFLTWLTSLEYVSVTRSTLLVATTPLWAGLLGFVFPALKPQKSFWYGLALSLAGIVLVTGTDHMTGRAHLGPTWFGDALAIAGSLCILPYMLLSQEVQKQAETGPVVRRIYVAAAISLWVLALIGRQPMLPANANGWLGVVGMAFVAQMIGHTSFNRALRHLSAAQVSTAALLEPVFAGLFAWILFGESLTLRQGTGAVLLLLGVGIALRTPKSETVVIEGSV